MEPKQLEYKMHDIVWVKLAGDKRWPSMVYMIYNMSGS